MSRDLGIAENPGPGRVSPIDRDGDLAAFIRERLGQMALVDLAAACKATFGPNRAPSKSAIHRFWCRLNRKKSVSKVPLKP